MTRQMALGLALAMVISSGAVDAQIGGLIKRKAGDLVGGKKPAPVPAPGTSAPAEPAPATPATGGAKKGTSAKSDPLAIGDLPVSQSTTAFLRGETELPFIPSTTVAAARVLGESAQVALVDTVGAAVKSLVMSPAFLAQHNEYIKSEHQAVDHGIKGVVSMEDALKKNDLKTLEALQRNQMVAMSVDVAANYPGDALKGELAGEAKRWRTYAADPKRRDRAKYQKMVGIADTIESLPGTDEKFRRGYAVIKSIDNDGPDTEAAVYAIHARFQQEKEQAAYDAHNLNALVRARLTRFIAVASKVNFDAPTVEKDGKTVFVNAADERQGALWKACFRAGSAPTAAAVKLAKAWLSEL